MENEQDFNDLKVDPTNKLVFWNLLLLPPFAISAILNLKYRNATSYAQAILASSLNVQHILKSEDDFDVNEHKEAIAYIISWL